MKKSIYNFEVKVWVSIPDQQEAIKALNLFWLNDKCCNTTDKNGRFIAKYPKHKNIEKLTKSHYSAFASQAIKMKMGMDKNGCFFMRGK